MKQIFFVIVAITLALNTPAQNIALSRADRLFELYAYSEAADAYENLLSRKQNDTYLIRQLGYCYLKMGLYKKSLGFFEQLVKKGALKNEDHYNYASLLLIDGRFDQAIDEFREYLQKMPNDQRAINQIERISNFSSLNLLHLVDTVYCLGINTRFADMSAAFYKDTIAFVSARDSSGRTYSWNDQPFLDIYYIGNNGRGDTTTQKIPKINTQYHEGPMDFINDDHTIWFTRNNENFSVNSQTEQTNNLKIYISDWNGKKWLRPRDFQYNSNSWSVGHPVFSKDERTLYFASNMPGSLGETDLYKSVKIDSVDKKGKPVEWWSEPVNLGPQFNTSGKEMFPFIDARGVIFFSSDGLPGFGGLDIFAAFPVADSFNVINLGQPINSTYDDFSFIVTDDFGSGYFTSNRPDGVGSDDIYSFIIGPQHFVFKVKDLKTGLPVQKANIEITGCDKGNPLGNTNENGEFVCDLDFRMKYYIKASHPNYIAGVDSIVPFEIFKIADRSKTLYLDNASQLQVLVRNNENEDPLSGVNITLTMPDGRNVEKTTDATGKVIHVLKNTGNIQMHFSKENFISADGRIVIDKLNEGNFGYSIGLDPVYEGKTFVLENLYYDLNSSEIRPDAAIVLDEVYKILVEFPAMKIELSSHTDCRGDNNYNQWLSQRRAQSAVEYLINKGISADRMVPFGAGETQLLNHCRDGVECSEEEHQINRRTEFKVLEIN